MTEHDLPREHGASNDQMSGYIRGPESAHSATPPALEPPTDPRERQSEGWAVGPDGTRVWGRDGAAGLLVVDRDRGVLLQHRALWSHHGGTWGLPGGARSPGEDAVDAAVREAHEEAAVPRDHLELRATRILDLGFWTYTTVIVEAVRPFQARITDAESAGLAWVVPGEVDRLELHPGFGAAWPTLRTLVECEPVVIVDVANVMGSVPDGWWRDRAAGIRSVLERLERIGQSGLPASWFELDAARLWPRLIAVVEGSAGHEVAAGWGATASGLAPRLEVVAATGSGDDTIAEIAAAHGTDALVATSDRGLVERVVAVGARTVGARRLRELGDD